ncbi:efflux RND transporter periplasmic adaptor subunit [Roseomonas sp. 18066]|uniref:efflux RND transporter periplasmic adaptor subunit n=1 Tax=Roseomonas sp. 18066 TaxID=2681412 RepID=UPI00135BEF20|nr:efflux RND transporter periplasmic adaptor subunit [Roseomonas sp. 18066]
MALPRTLLVLTGLAILGGGGYYYWKTRMAPAAEGQATPAGPGASPGASPGAGRRGPGGPGGGAGMAVPVTLGTAARKDLVLTLDALGTVQAMNTVTVRSKVSGQLMEILFREGQEVEKGAILARIDDRTYAAALAQAVAQKAYNAAQLSNAKLDQQRYEGLLRANGVTRQQVDTQRAQVMMYEAQVQQDQAAIDNARAQLDDTVIRAPFAGRVGIRAVDIGNLVASGDTNGIVTVAQFAPIAVNFTLPQQELPRLLRAMAVGQVPVETVPTPSSTPGLPGEAPDRGAVLTVGNLVDATTGSIAVKASFPNERRQLWPGAFVTLRLPVQTIRDALVVPLVAIQQGPAGSFVFVAKDDSTIEQRNVTLGATTRSEATIQTGLQPGERVVTSGAQRLNNGSRIAEVRPGGAAGGVAAPGEGAQPGAGNPQNPAPASGERPARRRESR